MVGRKTPFLFSVNASLFNKTALLFAILSVFLLQTNLCQAQDTLILTDGKKLSVKVMEVKKYMIQYKKTTNLNGPTYEYDIRDIGRIKYESGAVDEFNPIKGETATTESMIFGEIPKVTSVTLGRNVVYLNIVELVVQNLSISYERIIGPAGKLGIRIPLSVNLTGSGNVSSFINNYFYTGLDFNFYPFGQGQSRFIIGPSLRFGSTRLESNVLLPDGGSSYIIGPVSYSSFLIQGGFVWCPVKELSFLMTGGIGSRYYIANSGNIDRPARGTVNFTFCVGYRF
jgi:hypothetical protein